MQDLWILFRILKQSVAKVRLKQKLYIGLISFAIYLTMIEFLGLSEAEGGEAMTETGTAEVFFSVSSGAMEPGDVEPNIIF